MDKLTYITVWLFVLIPFFSETATYKSHYNQPFIIVIDAGHGGKDSGALGSWTQEKDITLKLALKVGTYLENHLPDVRVLYTRTTDKFIPLHERIALANNNNAAVFFSIHCNSVPSNNTATHGTETYVMGLHRAAENLEVAKRENKAVLLESDYSNNYQGYDPTSPEGHIMLSMYQNAYLNQSMLLAEKIESQFKNQVNRVSRGVKQANFLVLRAATMPSVLVEAGFLSNLEEENYLASEEGQVYMASAMFRAIRAYKISVEGKINADFQPVKGQNNTSETYSNQGSTKNQTTTTKPIIPKTTPKSTTTVWELPSTESIYPSVVFDNNNNNNIVFRVQLASSLVLTNLKAGAWKDMEGVEYLKIGTAYKCLLGKHNNLETAVEHQGYLRKKGFKDAFVVAFKNGQKISLEEATR